MRYQLSDKNLRLDTAIADRGFHEDLEARVHDHLPAALRDESG